jgi:hypothetical protein
MPPNAKPVTHPQGEKLERTIKHTGLHRALYGESSNNNVFDSLYSPLFN